MSHHFAEEKQKEKLAKHRISRNSILLYRTNICLFHIASHCFAFYFPSRFFGHSCVAPCSLRCPSFLPLFFFCHVHYYLFYFNAPADYYILILAQINYVLSFYPTFHMFDMEEPIRLPSPHWINFSVCSSVRLFVCSSVCLLSMKTR